jgi:membrane fusion protein (multidrug efflux system)
MSTSSAARPNAEAAPSAPGRVTVQWWKHPRARRVLTVVAGLALLGIVVWFFFYRPYVSTDDARVAATLVRLAPEGVSGKVIRLAVAEGDRVKSGQVLVELDHALTEANLAKAKAHASQVERELKRIEQLAAQNGVPPREVDNARAAAQTAQADLALAQIAYDRTFIKSPLDGVVVQKATEVGNILEPNQTALTVADIDHAWIAANIEETAVAAVHVGQPVTVEVDEGGTLTGKVSEVRAATASQFALIQSENPSGNFTKLVQRIPIKVELDAHPDRALRSGQSVELKIRVR